MKNSVLRLMPMVLSLSVLLGGCGLQSPEELYTLPEPPADYESLQDTLKAFQSQLETEFGSWEYAAPLTGDNTQTVQLHDFDNDGVDEAVAFFRVNSTDTPLVIGVFSKQDDDSYAVKYTIEGNGAAISSVSYPDLTGDGNLELAVSWQISDDVHSLGVYALEGDSSTELLMQAFSHYSLLDVDSDGRTELLMTQLASGASGGELQMYSYSDSVHAMRLAGSAPLSDSAQSFYSVTNGVLKNGSTAVYLTSAQADGSLVTDVFLAGAGGLNNVSCDSSGISASTVCTQTITPQDINGDGVIEIPVIRQLPQPASGSTGICWTVSWLQYNYLRHFNEVYRTFYNESEGWYLVLPDAWEGHITVTQSGSSSLGQRGTTFCYIDDNGDETPFLTIYRLTGTNRSARAAYEGRFVLQENGSVIYAAEFTGDRDCGMSEAALTNAFRLIGTSSS